jgi:signal transduction histidine kinase
MLVNSALKCLIALGIVVSASLPAAAANLKRVLVLQSNGQNFKPWSEYAKAFRQELEQQSNWPIVIQSFPVTLASDNDNAEGRFADFLKALFPSDPPDLIVAFGAPASAFVQRRRKDLFPTAPTLLAAIDERRIQRTALSDNDAVVPVWIDIPAIFGNILQVLPDTGTIAVVIGNSPNERFWVREMESQLEPLKGRVNVVFWNGLSFEEILTRAASLPKHSAIFWTQPQIDVTGAVHEGELALRRLYAAANAPIFSHDDSFFDGEIVGGPMTSVSQGSRTAATVAVRILGGEKAGEIGTPVLPYEAAKFDWRELKRWGIPESRLPAGSEVRFRPSSPWELYRWQIALICAVLLLQGGLIATLMHERRRRFHAEVQSRQRSAELAHINRFSTAGELTATIAHEINQPLGAILTNVETAESMIKSPAPDLQEIGEILADIRRDDMRAAQVIDRLRSLLKKVPLELKQIDVNDVARETMQFLSALAIAREVNLTSLISSTPLPVKGDPIQLQQVVLNLIVNAMDAMTGMPSAERRITVSTARDTNSADLSVSDVGSGIPVEKLKEVFEPFFTTKPRGMGMGLSIARTIVEAHDGQLWAENSAGRGATFRIRLPLAALSK